VASISIAFLCVSQPVGFGSRFAVCGFVVCTTSYFISLCFVTTFFPFGFWSFLFYFSSLAAGAAPRWRKRRCAVAEQTEAAPDACNALAPITVDRSSGAIPAVMGERRGIKGAPSYRALHGIVFYHAEQAVPVAVFVVTTNVIKQPMYALLCPGFHRSISQKPMV
jgi:hypothetical protein